MSHGHAYDHTMVLGCGRSGTSIFGELFDDIPAYRYYSEPPFVELTSFDYSTPIAVKVPTESPGYRPSAGLSFPVDELLSVLPEPRRFFWIVRHPLDAICSLRVGIEQNWGHHPKPPDWREWLEKPLLERCAHHWNHINSVGFEQVRDLVTVVKFEEMIRDPRRFADDICTAVGIVPSDHLDSREKWAGRVQNSNNVPATTLVLTIVYESAGGRKTLARLRRTDFSPC